MKKLIYILVFLACQKAVVAQLPGFEHNYRNSDSTDNTVFLHFSGKHDFVISKTISSYWWAGREYYQILAHSDSGWSAWQYINFELKKQKGAKIVSVNKAKIVAGHYQKLRSFSTDGPVNLLFDSLKAYNFFSLNSDSLNVTRGQTIYDLEYYRFDVLSSKKARVISSYAPEDYLELFPDMRERRNFILARNYFDNWWNKYCSKGVTKKRNNSAFQQ